MGRVLPLESVGGIREPPDSGLSGQWEGDLRAQVAPLGVGLELRWGRKWQGPGLSCLAWFQMELQSSKHSQHGGRMAQLASHSGSESARPPQSPFNGFFGIC